MTDDTEIVGQFYGGKNTFHNITGSAGMNWQINLNLQLTSNLGAAWRAPSANELYSNGLHHGAGLYEVGDPALKSEQAYKWTTGVKGHLGPLSLNLDFYTQLINNYIFAQPDLEFRQTVSGTYPVFRYTQTNASFIGADFSGSYQLFATLKYQLSASLVRARNINSGTYLPYIPSDNLRQNISWNPLSTKASDAYIKINHQFVSRQTRYASETDYAAPPPLYHLFGLAAGNAWKIKQQKISAHASVENLLNVSYKNYMNRYRYHIHDLGRNITLRLAYPF